jgi:alkanesulfonate monooxygenase SsuD/methylene tetrahydromethanopterin reductase-like flavin-dependent oxidoreductase (luciferase family)
LAVGPGSSALDYRAVGIDFAERWKRLDEAIGALRSLWRPHDEPFTGDYYSTEDIALSPAPARPGGPPIWIGSWGSDAGLRRTARLGDGWLASAYNTTPADFAEARARLADHLERHDRDPAAFPNALATLWFHITDDTREAEAIYTQRLLPNINRPEEQVRQRLPVGSPERVAELLVAFAGAGVQRVYVWPVVDEISQIQRFAQDVIPLVTAS